MFGGTTQKLREKLYIITRNQLQSIVKLIQFKYELRTRANFGRLVTTCVIRVFGKSHRNQILDWIQTNISQTKFIFHMPKHHVPFQIPLNFTFVGTFLTVKLCFFSAFELAVVMESTLFPVHFAATALPKAVRILNEALKIVWKNVQQLKCGRGVHLGEL